MKSCFYFLVISLMIFLSSCNTGEGWTLVWSDEFDYTGMPDPEKWDYEQGYIRNHELQCYTNRPENVWVDVSALPLEYEIDYVRYYKSKNI